MSSLYEDTFLEAVVTFFWLFLIWVSKFVVSNSKRTSPFETLSPTATFTFKTSAETSEETFFVLEDLITPEPVILLEIFPFATV